MQWFLVGVGIRQFLIPWKAVHPHEEASVAKKAFTKGELPVVQGKLLLQFMIPMILKKKRFKMVLGAWGLSSL